MVKANVKGLKSAKRSVRQQMADAIKDGKLYEDLADTVRKRVRKNAKRPADGTRYPKLKRSTIENRRRLARNNSTHPKYRLRRPNLTLTGEFLDSLTSRFNKSKLRITLFFKGSHKGYRNQDGSRGKRVKNSKIAEGMRGIGRGVLTKKDGKTTMLSKKIVTDVTERIRKALRRKFR